MKEISENATLLLVDDNMVNLKLLAGFLNNKEYKLAFATSGQEALEIVHDTIVDLVLLDIMMPGMDGFEVCRKLKSDPGTSSIPVMFVSALVDKSDMQLAYACGGDDYLTKPIKDAEIRHKVKLHLQFSRLKKELEHKQKINGSNRILFNEQALENPDPMYIQGFQSFLRDIIDLGPSEFYSELKHWLSNRTVHPDGELNRKT
ncbi:MAG: hypothetical protein Kow00127_05570 [Bacteroidales bacterium]